MRLLGILIFLVSLSCFGGERGAKLVYFKGEVTLLRNNTSVSLKKGLALKTGDIIHTEKKGLAIIKSRASTYKVSPNSTLKIDLDTPEIINSDVQFGTVVVRFFKHKLNQSVGKKMRIKTPTAAMGIRGTRFFTYVAKERSNSILTVESGVVAFEGRNSSKEVLVKEGLSSMTNKNDQVLKTRKFGFESKINWTLDENSSDLSHDPKLVSELDKVWNKYKEENAKLWKNRSNEMEDLWKKYK